MGDNIDDIIDSQFEKRKRMHDDDEGQESFSKKVDLMFSTKDQITSSG